MQCPSCGLQLSQPTPDRCPQCGRLLAAAPEPTPQISQAASPNDPRTSANAPTGYPPGLLAPLPERKQRRAGLVVGIIVAAVVLLAACAGGTIWATRSMGQPNFTDQSGTRSASVSSTPSESVIYYESFSTSAEGWAQDPGRCYLDQDGYHAKNNYICFAPIADQTDGSVSVFVQQLSGPTTQGYGLVFRNPDNHTDSGYRFGVASAGEWAFDKCVNGDCTTLVDYTPNSAIKRGLHSANTLQVTATGSHFEFFINDTKVGSFDDATFASGAVGVFGGDAIDCVFTHFTVSTPLS